jgi:hypothetical protein
MADVRQQTGEGTLYDTDDNELATVAYRVAPISPEGADVHEWGGEIFFPDSTMVVEPGLYVLALEDGTQMDIDVAPPGAAGGDSSTLEFTGVGTFGRRIL